jgi:hypothetical protein
MLSGSSAVRDWRLGIDPTRMSTWSRILVEMSGFTGAGIMPSILAVRGADSNLWFVAP